MSEIKLYECEITSLSLKLTLFLTKEFYPLNSKNRSLWRHHFRLLSNNCLHIFVESKNVNDFLLRDVSSYSILFHSYSFLLVPLVLEMCSSVIEEHGIVDGIYRLSGITSNMQKLR